MRIISTFFKSKYDDGEVVVYWSGGPIETEGQFDIESLKEFLDVNDMMSDLAKYLTEYDVRQLLKIDLEYCELGTGKGKDSCLIYEVRKAKLLENE